MHITQLYTYPIKSLRGASLSSATLTRHGFPHDRRFMLLKILPDSSLKNMTVTYFPEMALFTQSLSHTTSDSATTFLVTHLDPSTSSQTQLSIPLAPNVSDLEILDVVLHSSPTKAYEMGLHVNGWFSACFGFAVKLVYLGPHLRPVLGNLSPNAARPQPVGSSWLSAVTSRVPFMSENREDKEGITFADVAPYLVVTEESLADVSARLPEGEEMDVRKFRPNIVLKGAEAAYEEDFWGALVLRSGGELGKEIRIELTQNCARCVSINVDFDTGKWGEGESGSMLKKMMKDRRVDPGAKWSPIFGRYGFLLNPAEGAGISVGDQVEVAKRNDKRTVFDWPGLGSQ